MADQSTIDVDVTLDKETGEVKGTDSDRDVTVGGFVFEVATLRKAAERLAERAKTVYKLAKDTTKGFDDLEGEVINKKDPTQMIMWGGPERVLISVAFEHFKQLTYAIRIADEIIAMLPAKWEDGETMIASFFDKLREI